MNNFYFQTFQSGGRCDCLPVINKCIYNFTEHTELDRRDGEDKRILKSNMYGLKSKLLIYYIK